MFRNTGKQWLEDPATPFFPRQCQFCCLWPCPQAPTLQQILQDETGSKNETNPCLSRHLTRKRKDQEFTEKREST